MGGRLANKIAIVTGAGRGIGAAIAQRFADEGAGVLLAARSAEALAQVSEAIAARGGRAAWHAADIGTAEGCSAVVTEAVRRFEHLDLLVHNAGIFPMTPIETMTDAQWEAVLAVNLTSALRLSRACIPHLRRRGGGRLLFTSSVTGNRVAVPGCAHYAASKAGLNGFIRSAALELAGDRITVNGVEPGLVLTPGASAETSAEQRDAMARFVPMQRWGEPHEVAAAMLYLASDEAGYVTGQTLVIDGGALLPENGALMLDA